MIRKQGLTQRRRVAATASRYAAATGAAVAVVLAADALEGFFQGVRFSIPIAITALLALLLGAGPGAAFAALVGAGIWYFVQSPRGAFLPLDAPEVPRLVAYFLASGCVLLAIGLLDRTRRRLADQAERLRTLAENSPEVIARFDRQLRHVYVNAYGARVYGKSRDEVLGKTNAELGMPPDKVAFWRERFEQVFATGRQQTVDFEFDGPSFGHQVFSSLFVPETDGEGRVVSVLAITRDVSELRRAEAGLRHAAEILELGDAHVEVDRDWRVVRVNAQLERLSGMPRSRSVGRTLWDVWPDAARPTSAYSREYRRCMEERVPVQFEERYGPLDLWTAVTAYPVSTGGIAIFSRDIGPRKRVEEALRGSEAKFRSIFEQGAIGMGRVAFADARWVDVNAAFCRMLGRSREEMLRVPWPAMTHPEDLDLDLVPFRQMAAGQLESYSVEKRFLHADGHPVWARLTLSLVRDASGRPDYEIAFIEDIGDRKRAEGERRESASRLQAIVETIPVGLFILGVDGRAMLVNDEAKRLWAGAGRLSGIADFAEYQGVWPDTGAPLAPEDWPAAQALRGRTTKGVLIDIRRFDGGRRTIVASAAPLRDAEGNLVGGVTANQDVTELREAQARLEDVDRRKNEFLAMLSHELRNPLAPIKNGVFLLEHAAPDSPQARRAREVIGRQVAQLTRLVDDLLDVTRISRGKIRLQRERVDVCTLVQRTAEDHRSIFAGAGVQLEVATCGAPLPTKGDPARLAQVVGNLLTNAAKFTPGGGRVEVSVERDGDAAVIRVRDTGAGVEAGLLERLFDPFVQAEATLDRSKGGLGLGLSLVKGLVELHGGSVSAHSDGPGRGATFVVKLPVEDVPAAEVRPPRASSPGCGARTLRVLLIEDNADAAESLKEALAFGGHQVEIANTGFEGLAKVRGFGPDVVLCDLGLPGIDGFEVARRMRADPAVEAPLVALSGYAGPEDLERSREAGFARHVAKPPDLDELERVLCDVSSPAPDAHPDGP